MKTRLMPDKFHLGTQVNSVMGQHLLFKKDMDEGQSQFVNPDKLRTVMGYLLPVWQRPLVWTQDQMVAFIESAWRGLPLGTCTYTLNLHNDKLDGLLIDGQQRMYAIECYLADMFPVFGYKWSEVTKLDERVFKTGITFPSYILENNDDEEFLKEYYDIMNYGGTSHTEDQRAT